MKRPFNSKFTFWFEEYIASRQSAGTWCNTYYENLHYFDNYIVSKYAKAEKIEEGMLDWCNPRGSENGNSCRVRTTVVWNFIEYANKRGWTNLIVQRNPANEPCSYLPHFFTIKELHDFFTECDTYLITLYRKNKSLRNLLNRMELPVYYRLLLSSGMRTCEARWLKRTDVDFKTGVVNIEKSKGADQHRVVLHDSTLQILIKYDSAMDKVIPNRNYLFPDRNDDVRRAAWGSYFFRIIWSKTSRKRACEYDLRSLYAVTNISKWENHGYELSGKLLFLSRSMGHRDIQSTLGYFHLTPMLTDKLKHNTAKNFSELIPKLPDTDEKEL
jgi:integrase